MSMLAGNYRYTQMETIFHLEFVDDFYISINGTLSIYSMAVISPPTYGSGPARVLIAASNKIYHICSSDDGELIKSVFSLPCLPRNVLIKSVAGYIDDESSELCYAFSTVLKDEDDSMEGEFGLHIHQQNHSCQYVPLYCNPYQLVCTTVPCINGELPLWIITGRSMSVVGPSFLRRLQKPAKLDTTAEVTTDDKELTQEDDPSQIKSTRKVRFSRGNNDASGQSENKPSGSKSGSKKKNSNEKSSSESADGCDAADSGTDTEGTESTVKVEELSGNEKTVEGASPEEDQGEEEEEDDSPYALLDPLEYFPEFEKVDSRVLKISFQRTPNDSRRLTCLGGENGSVAVYETQLRVDQDLSSSALTPTNLDKNRRKGVPFSWRLHSTPLKETENQQPQTNSNIRSDLKSELENLNMESKVNKDVPDKIIEDKSSDVKGPVEACGRSLASDETKVNEVVRVFKCKTTVERKFRMKYPVPSVELFRVNDSRLPHPDPFSDIPGLKDKLQCTRTPLYHLLVANPVCKSVVYNTFTSKCPGKRIGLPYSSRHDSVLCCHIAHLKGDSIKYLLLGTYGQTILIYKNGKLDAKGGLTWNLHTKISAGAPVLSIEFADITGDGQRELIVLTSAGLQTFRLDSGMVATVITNRLLDFITKNKIKTPPPSRFLFPIPGTPSYDAHTRAAGGADAMAGQSQSPPLSSAIRKLDL